MVFRRAARDFLQQLVYSLGTAVWFVFLTPLVISTEVVPHLPSSSQHPLDQVLEACPSCPSRCLRGVSPKFEVRTISSSLSLLFSATLLMLLCPSGVLVPMKTFSRLPIRIIAVTSDHNFLHQTQSLSKTERAILAMNGVHVH